MTNMHDKNKKIRVGIFFGGRSAEHEVSLMSAKNVLEAIDTEKFDPVLIGIDKKGVWHMQNPPARLESGALAELPSPGASVALTLLPGSGGLIEAGSQEPAQLIDVALPILHGPMGEDGSIQGFLELANIPYVGPGILGSAVGMDKDIMKRLLRDAGIPITAFKTFFLHQKSHIDAAAVFKELGKAVFVKPANMGSSVGVNRASNERELQDAIDEAFSFDTKIIIESAVEGDEIECAVLGNEQPKASVVGRIIPRAGDFYSYEAKYLDENGAVLEIPAKIPRELSDTARELAVKTFQALGCEGMGRVDMFLTKDDKVIVNEINTIPGFTKISMYPKLWEATGVPYQELITELINLAIARHERQHKLRSSYQ